MPSKTSTLRKKAMSGYMYSTRNDQASDDGCKVKRYISGIRTLIHKCRLKRQTAKSTTTAGPALSREASSHVSGKRCKAIRVLDKVRQHARQDEIGASTEKADDDSSIATTFDRSDSVDRLFRPQWAPSHALWASAAQVPRTKLAFSRPMPAQDARSIVPSIIHVRRAPTVSTRTATFASGNTLLGAYARGYEDARAVVKEEVRKEMIEGGRTRGCANCATQLRRRNAVVRRGRRSGRRVVVGTEGYVLE